MNNSAGVDAAFEDTKLDLDLATKEGLFYRAEDFWAVVGWAFTCACGREERGVEVASNKADKNKVDRNKVRMMKRRWRGAWKRLLCVMVEGLERDWAWRLASASAIEEEEERDRLLKQALIIRLLPPKRGSAGYKRVIRAIMANGQCRLGSMEWKEIWRDECISRKEIRKRRKRGDVRALVPLTAEEVRAAKKNRTLEKDSSDSDDDTQDEDDEDDVDEAEEKKSEGDCGGNGDKMEGIKYSKSHKYKPEEDPIKDWGGLDAVFLRQRLLALVSPSKPPPTFPPHDPLTNYSCLFNPAILGLLHTRIHSPPNPSLRANRYSAFSLPPYPPSVYLPITIPSLLPLVTSFITRFSSLTSRPNTKPRTPYPPHPLFSINPVPPTHPAMFGSP